MIVSLERDQFSVPIVKESVMNTIKELQRRDTEELVIQVRRDIAEIEREIELEEAEREGILRSQHPEEFMELDALE